ncbi:DNA-directed primase/polymerase protein isoform X4 [Heterocephalus glaber]|uniref:DNA-directed primase/polymerase protein n=1 Tax=Heterocephalus glaber TaxID=10181 RepID=A0AAX6TIG8_HETGA|nr:DNA-directed primase/polymerase protein isoform X4 [Heterocephalus glaber]
MMGKWEAKLKQIEERASCYERKPLSSVYRPRLSKPEDPSSVWKLFHRQNQAFNFVKSCKENVHVFALECKVGDGQRIYLVTTYAQLWFYYKSRKHLLHCYEVIPENAVCKLYFDLEFNKHANPEADGKKMVVLLIEHVCKALQELYSVSCSAEDVFNLDSSTDEKFSRHLIFQLHDVAFKDNIHVGNFVRKILQPALHLISSEYDNRIPNPVGHEFSHFPETPLKQEISFNQTSPDKDIAKSWTLNSEIPERLESAEQSSPDLSFLVVKSNTGEEHLFVDLGVYTRNRNFRLYKSSKIGKCVALEVAEDNKFFPKQSKNISEENQYFLSSLVSNIRFSDSLRILTCDTSQNKRKRTEHVNSTSSSVETIEGFQCSPYPEIDRFVLSLVTKNDTKGDIAGVKTLEELTRVIISCFPLPAEVSLLFLFKEEEFTADETWNSEAKNPGASSDTDWDNSTDDVYFLQATEDAELAEAAENSLLSYTSAVNEIPDELIIEVLQE